MSTENEEKDASSEEAVVNAEVEWGRTYRHQKKQGRRVSLVPTPSPFNIQKLWEQYQMSKELREIKELKRKLLIKPIPVITKLPKGRVDPDTVSKKVYYNYMSTPRRYPEPQPLPIKPKHRKEECSPRLIYLSLPTKVRVLHTWKDYRCTLPIDFITRLEELLHTDHNLDPKFARCYFKTLDRLKRKQRNKLRKKQKERKKQQRQESKEWLKMQIRLTTDLLVKFLKKEPLFSLNFKQMMLSEAILNALHERGDIKTIPPRNSNKPYSRAVIDIVDQLSVWVDTIVRYVDVQYTESVEAVVEVPSMGSFMEMEEEEEEEEEEEKPKRFSLPPLPSLPEMPPLPDVPGMPHIKEEAEGGDSSTYGTSTFEGIIQEPEDESEDTINLTLREDTLEMLIKILSYSSPDMLQQLVNPEVLPDITYKDVLDRLHDLRDQTQAQLKKERKTALEDAMLAWARSNQPEKVDKQIVGKIQHAAGILSECLGKEEKALSFTTSLPPVKIDTTSVSGESSFNPPTTDVEHTVSGEVTTAGDLSEPEASEAGRALETLQEEGVTSATSGQTVSQDGEGEASIGSKLGALTVKANESKTKLPTVVSGVSQVDQEFAEVSKLDMTSELKVVMGEVPSPEQSQYVLGMIPEEEVKKTSVASKVAASSGASLPPGAASVQSQAPQAPPTSSGASLPSKTPTTPSAPSGASVSSKTPTAPSAPLVPSGASLPSKTPTAPSAPSASSGASLPSKTPTAPSAPSASSGASLPSKTPTAPSAPSAPSGASLPSKTPTASSKPSGVSLPSKTPTAPSKPSGVSLPSKTPTVPTAPSGVSLPSKAPTVPAVPSGASVPSKAPTAPSGVSLPPGVSLPSGISVPSRIPGTSVPEGVSKTSVPFVIPGHKPSKVFEHQPDTICCLTLKVWATWLLEVAHNAHAWSRWLNDIINEVRRIASIIRGEVKDDAGNPVVFYKEDWIEFSEKVDNMITSWRQYSMHVKDLTDKIVHNFRGKTVTCCPKCLEDNLIVDVSLAHNISQQLAEAMNTAGYWRRWLDSVVMETKRLTGATLLDNESQVSSYGTMELIELHEAHTAESEESLYEIEELDPTNENNL